MCNYVNLFHRAALETYHVMCLLEGPGVQEASDVRFSCMDCTTRINQQRWSKWDAARYLPFPLNDPPRIRC